MTGWRAFWTALGLGLLLACATSGEPTEVRVWRDLEPPSHCEPRGLIHGRESSGRPAIEDLKREARNAGANLVRLEYLIEGHSEGRTAIGQAYACPEGSLADHRMCTETLGDADL